MLSRKASHNNAAAKITSVTLESNNLVTYLTEDAHGLFVGAIASVSGVLGGPSGATTPNPTVSNIYRVDNPKSFTIRVDTPYTATSFPFTFSSSGTVQVTQGALNTVHLSYAEPVKVVRPSFFNFITPEVNAIASGNRVLLSWDASGVAYPIPTVTIGRYDSTGNTLLGLVSTAASGSSVIDPPEVDLDPKTEYVYKITAVNTSAVVNASTSVTSLYVDTPTNLVAKPTENVANSISVNWSAPQTNAVLTSYTVQRSTNGGAFATAYATTLGSVTSFTDTGLVETSSYRYRVLTTADYTSAGTGKLTSGVTATSASITPYFISTVTPTATVTASTANSITVTWSAPVTSNPPVSGYSLQRSSDGGTTWSANLTSTTSTSTTYVDSAASSGLVYTYRLAAINAQLTSAYTSSGTATAYFLNDPLKEPTVTRTSISTTSLTVTGSFSANPTISGYNIQRALTSSPTSFTNIGSTTFANSTTTGNVLSYIDTTVQPNTSYIYQIKAKNAQLTTNNWSASSASILSYSVPFNPTSVSASSVDSSSVKISWSGASVNSTNTPITSYTLGYKLASTTTYTTLTGISATSSSYTLGGLTTDSAYDFRILAVNSIGTSSTVGAIVRTATPTRVAGTASLADPGPTATIGSFIYTPIYFNLAKTLTVTTNPGRTVQFKISSDGTNWSNLGSAIIANSSGKASVSYTSDTVDAYRYFYAQVAQDNFYTTTISNVVYLYNLKNPLSITISNSNSGNTRYASVNVKDAAGNNVSGASVGFDLEYFSISRYRHANTSTDASGNASTSFTLDTSWAVNAIASKTNYVSVTSSDTVQYVNETFNTDATSSRSYKGNDALRSDFATNERCYYGYYKASNEPTSIQGNQKSAVWFSDWYNANATDTWDKINGAHALVNAYVYVKRGDSAGAASNSSVRIGIHENANVTNDWGNLTVAAALQTFTLDHSEGSGTFPTGADVTAAFRPYTTKNSGSNIYGIVIGPGATNTYVAANYGWLYGANVTGQPYITFVIQADPYA
jgi:hypothetical protein